MSDRNQKKEEVRVRQLKQARLELENTIITLAELEKTVFINSGLPIIETGEILSHIRDSKLAATKALDLFFIKHLGE